jgi:hypothetical protein
MVKGIPKRRIEELVSRWKLEGLRQVVVEGSTDFRMLGLIMKKDGCPAGLQKLDRLPIDLVEVPDSMLAKHQLTSGNKQKIIAFGREIEALGQMMGFRGVVDRDLDTVRDRDFSSPSVRYTDFCCMESYMWQPDVLRQVLHQFSCEETFPSNDAVAALFDSISEACKQIFAVRVVHDKKPEWMLEIHHSDASLGMVDGKLQLDLSKYLHQCKPRREQREEFEKEVQKSVGDLAGVAVENALHGHDLLWLLEYVVKNCTSAKRHLAGGEQILPAVLNYSALLYDFPSQPLFAHLDEWMQTA